MNIVSTRTVIPRRSAASNPESRDSGFGASYRLEITANLIRPCEIAFLPDLGKLRVMRGPGPGLVFGQRIEAFQHLDAILAQTRGNRGAIGEMPPHGIEPDRAPREKAAGTGRIGIFQHALESVGRSTGRQQHPGNAPLGTDLADRVELILRSSGSSAAVARRQGIGREQI